MKKLSRVILVLKNSISKKKILRLLNLKSNSKLFLLFNFVFLTFTVNLSKADDNNLSLVKNDSIGIEYLESRNELEDYIIDSGDGIYLEFFPATELNGIYQINEEGEMILPNLDETYVRGLTIAELKGLLEKRYSEFLISPDIKVKIAIFKSIRVLIKGEIRNPGLYTFPSYKSVAVLNLNKKYFLDDKSIEEQDENFRFNGNITNSISSDNVLNRRSSGNIIDRRSSDYITNISDIIWKAGGITSFTDLSRIEITRNVPLGKGGGKKRAIVNFNSFINESDPTNDIRLFDGDSVFFPKLSGANQSQISKSILSGISPRFILVDLFGRVENPGPIRLPLEAALSDAIDLTGPIKPLSGKVVLIRYKVDGSVLKKNISYSANALRGSKRNPYLKENDLISVKNSFIGKSSDVIKEITAPFLGIYTTKKIIDEF